MRNIEILDCTLRDGGYVNNWNFTLKNIKAIINDLSFAGVEYIECGFINNKNANFDVNQSIYSEINELEKILKTTNEKTHLALMMQTSDYDIKKIPQYLNGKVNVIRLSFHKSDIDKAIDYALNIKAKGYKLFFQPTSINNYSEDEMKELSKICNEIIKPDAFAIVDTLGVLNSEDIKNISNLFDKELNREIKLLLHCHNNLQLAYTNAITFINNTQKDRNIIIDTSLLGMGRGAGNLSTEILLTYLNKNYNKKYNYEKILQLLDEVMTDILKKYQWGYSLYYFINAENKVHPNYGTYIRDKIKGININTLNCLLEAIPDDKKSEFNIKCANKLIDGYKYKSNDSESYKKLKEQILNKKIIISRNFKDKNIDEYGEDVFFISMNTKFDENIDAIVINDIEEFNNIKHKINSDTIIIAPFSFDENSNIVQFNCLKLLVNQSLTKTDLLIVMLLQILVYCSAKNIIIEDFKLDNNKFLKYRISKTFDENTELKNENIINEYINYFNKNYNVEIKKERMY